LREVDFQFEGQTLPGLEQNPKTDSRWARLAREVKKVMQFLSDRRYIANVGDGKVQFYGHSGGRKLTDQTGKEVGSSRATVVSGLVRMAQSWCKQFSPMRVKYNPSSLSGFCDEEFACRWRFGNESVPKRSCPPKRRFVR
jgi:hypothetical protein